MSSTRISIVRDSIIRIVQMLTAKKVQVTQRGSSAYVTYNHDGSPKLVNIPYIPEDAADDLLAATQGFLDHEVAHVLYTDYAAVKKANEIGVASLHNIYEDSFIERKMAQNFPGSAFNLTEMGAYFVQNYTTPRIAGLSAGDPVLEGVLIVPAIRAWAGQKVFKDYMDDGDKWKLIDKIVTRLTPLIPRVAKIANSHDALQLAIDTKAALSLPPEEERKAPAPKARPPKPKKSKERKAGERPAAPPKKGEGGDDESEMTDDFEGTGETVGAGSAGETPPAVEDTPEEPGTEPAPAGDDPEDEADDESEDDGLSTSDDDSDEDDEDEGGEPGDEEAEESASGSGDYDSESSSGGGGPSKSSGDLYSSIEKEIEKDFDEELSKLITKTASEGMERSRYKVYSKDFDKIEPLAITHTYTDDLMKKMTEAVDHMVGPLQKDFERAIAAKSASTWSGGHRSGRLHASSLTRLKTGDDRVFRRKHINNGKDVAVSLLVDCSGSMGMCGKIEAASYAAYALASVLDRMNINNEVLGFTTTSGGMPKEMFAEEKKHGFRYGRTLPLYIPILKGFNERLNPETKKRFASLQGAGWLWENVDGESVEIAAQRLAQRREARKVLFVFSDGSPACPGDRQQQIDHLKAVVQKVESSGVEVMGIGIADNNAARFYKRHVLLTNISDLPTTVIGEIKKILMK